MMPHHPRFVFARRSAALLLGLAVIAPQQVGAAPQKGALPADVEVVAPAAQDRSRPLRTLTGAASQAPAPVPRLGRSTPESGARTPDGALSPAQGTPFPGPTASFEGVANIHNPQKVLPPDTQGDVGLAHYLQITNVSFAIFDKGGNVLLGPLPNNAIWAGFGGPCEATNHGDPIVLYDELAHRWLFTQFSQPAWPSGPYFQCVAVSATADPTGAWHRYAYPWSDTKLNDYPKFAVWPDGYTMTTNQFNVTHPLTPFAGVGVAIFDRAAMLSGQPADMIRLDLEAQPDLFGLLPAELDGPPPPPGTPPLFAQMDDDFFVGTPADRLRLFEMHVSWQQPEQTAFGWEQALPVAAFDSALCSFSIACIPQPIPGPRVDALSDRLMYRLQYRNMGTHEAMVVSHAVNVADGGDRAGMRWYELRRAGGPWGIHQQGTYAGDDPSTDDEHRWMGSAALNGSGDMALGYSVSNDATTFPSIRYTGRMAADPPGTVRPETPLIAGGGSQLSDRRRWGDYSMMSVDPDGCTFWYTQQYYAATSERDWQTRIGALRAPAAPDTAPPSSVVMLGPGDTWELSGKRAHASWGAIDCQSGLAGHDVRTRRAKWNGGFRAPQTLLAGSPLTQATFAVEPGFTYCFSTRAADVAGHVSAWSSEACTAVPLDVRAFKHKGDWRKRRGGGYYLRTFSITREEGAKLVRWNVHAKRLGLLVTKCPHCGKIRVIHAGKRLGKINLKRKKGRRAIFIPLREYPQIRRGKLRIVVLSDRKKVKIEGLAFSRV